jgi:hypothetical protein
VCAAHSRSIMGMRTGLTTGWESMTGAADGLPSTNLGGRLVRGEKPSAKAQLGY